ncbi:MAG: hypothetical protein M4579_006846 [Chaenotheca gracillima]|nr:MAG: hypothetical protein M4579_006846 [Chaenotheca gracillima]
MGLRVFICVWAALVVAIAARPPQKIIRKPHEERNLRTISAIYDNTVYPNNVPIIVNGSAAVPPNLFSRNATGRVSPVGNFTGFEDSIEYFFALAPTPQTNPRKGAIISAEVVEFASACPEVAASLVHLRGGVVDETSSENGKEVAILKQFAFWRFDEDGLVTKYDAIIPNLSAWRDVFWGSITADPAVQAETIGQICFGTQLRCTGPNQQYDDVEDCIEQLSSKTFGTYSEAWGDTVACRGVHIILTSVRPDDQIHCPHVGPSGGDSCLDVSYAAKYEDDAELFGTPVGDTFKCPGR